LPTYADERTERVDEEADAWPEFWCRSPLCAGPDHSLSVAGELEELSISPALPPPFFVLPEAMLKDEELELMSLSLAFSFSSKPMKIRDRASL